MQSVVMIFSVPPCAYPRANTGLSVLQPMPTSGMTIPDFYRLSTESSLQGAPSQDSLLIGPSVTLPLRHPSVMSARDDLSPSSGAAAGGILRSPRGRYITASVPSGGNRPSSCPPTAQERNVSDAAAASRDGGESSSSRRLSGVRSVAPPGSMGPSSEPDFGRVATEGGGRVRAREDQRERERQKDPYEVGLANISWLNTT